MLEIMTIVTHKLPFECEAALELANIHQDYAKLTVILSRALNTISGIRRKAYRYDPQWSLNGINYQRELIKTLIERIEDSKEREAYKAQYIGD